MALTADVRRMRARCRRLEAAAKEVVEAHAGVIAAVTPGSPDFLKSTPEDRERYEALFSRWHAKTRALREILGE